MTRLFLFMVLLLGQMAVAQKLRWHEFKPNTRSDSLAIISNKVRSMKITLWYESDTGLTKLNLYDSLRYFYYSGNHIDSVTGTYSVFAFDEPYKEVFRSETKIIEKVIFPKQATYKRTYYLNEKGEVVRTENEWKKGGGLEGESFERVVHKYERGLLIESQFYDKKDDGYIYWTRRYSYELK